MGELTCMGLAAVLEVKQRDHFPSPSSIVGPHNHLETHFGKSIKYPYIFMRYVIVRVLCDPTLELDFMLQVAGHVNNR